MRSAPVDAGRLAWCGAFVGDVWSSDEHAGADLFRLDAEGIAEGRIFREGHLDKAAVERAEAAGVDHAARPPLSGAGEQTMRSAGAPQKS